MTKKNKKGPKGAVSNEPVPSSSAAQSSSSSQNNPSKTKNVPKAQIQNTPSSAQPSTSNQKPSKQNANMTNKSKPNAQKGNANVNKSKDNGPNANAANKPKPNVPPRKISLAPKAAEFTPREMKPLPAPRCIHAPVQFRLKCILLFKQECPMYCPENLETPPVNFFFKKNPSDIKLPQEMEIFKSVDQIVAANLKEPNSLNMILKIILSVLDNNNPLLINYDMVLYVLAKCLQLVRQDPNAKLPSPSIIDFRTRVLNLAVDRVCGQNSQRFLMFALYLLSLSRKAFQVEAVRKQLKHWYMMKEADQLLLMVAKCSSYQGLTHAMLLKEIHFDVTNQSTDKKLALFAIMFGFSYIGHRLDSGKFLSKPTVPKFVTESDVFDKGSDKVKGIIKDVAVARCPTSHQKVVAAKVKAHNLGIEDVAPQFHKSFKVNTACLELMSRRELLQSMHRLRIDNILSSEPHAIVDTVSTADTYVRTLNAATAEPPLHPAEVLRAFAEYALVPKVKLASLVKKEEGESQKADGKDIPSKQAKSPASPAKKEEGQAKDVPSKLTKGPASLAKKEEGQAKDVPSKLTKAPASLVKKEKGESQKADGKDVPTKQAKAPEPAILSVLNQLYKSSFVNLKTHESLKVMVCLDLQACMTSRGVHNYPALMGSHVAMHVLEVLYKMVGQKADQMKVVAFRDVDVKPIKILKLHVTEGTPAPAPAAEGESNLEQLDDLVDQLLSETCKVKTEAEGEEAKVKPEEEKEEGGGGGDTNGSGDSIIGGCEKLWKHYKTQVPEAKGVTFHKLLSWASKQLWDPDVFVVICSQQNVSLYKNNVMFGEYVKKASRAKTKLVTISPCSHLKSCRLIHAKNMLHIVGFDEKVTHLIEDFLSDKIQPLKEETVVVASVNVAF